ncbi:hypothetical protein HNR60_002850 [Rhodopseudomonas rhenobacensis]|uniref:Uncharacterized protein n=1 Tax=Rhodopseudomonas rhenobacensis TaxID=87461 RepID=A0A7W7Z504_9BRAD|nr:hypothetical protein [Rhodopseudomonas rhenobacensis]MBB5048089.1 hypothetical protein [Rhodopseudomonas rhenobacensis]
MASTRPSSRKSAKALAGLAAAGVLLAGVGVAIASRGAGAPQARLQELANNAALAGVTALADSIGKPGEQRIAASVAAAKTSLADQPATLHRVAASAEQLTMSVVLIDPGKRSEVKATARYVAPSQGRSAQQAAGLPAAAASPRGL